LVEAIIIGVASSYFFKEEKEEETHNKPGSKHEPLQLII
jgi:hypothetical protein